MTRGEKEIKNMKNQSIKILIAGEGGQGVQTIAKVLQRAAFEKNKETLYVPNFGVEQRGGVSIAFLQISENKIFYPKFQKADIVVILSDRSVDRVKSYTDKKTSVMYNSSLIKEIDVKAKALEAIDATNIAVEKFSPKVVNIIILGAMIKYFKFLDKDAIIKAMEVELGDKFKNNNELRECNLKALEISL